ncbi:MAG: PAS domain S-box protein [Pirellulales bacterium]|nr:PAS domain S-box protein [Pirellulales bacterium]
MEGNARRSPSVRAGRRRSESLLRESEHRFRVSFEQAAVGMAHVDLDGRWLRVNERLCEIVGYRREQLLSRTFQEITWPEDLDEDLANVRRLLAGEIPHYTIEKRYIRSDASLIWVSLTVALYRDEAGQPGYFHVVVQDISGRKQTEEALRQNEERLRLALEAGRMGTWDWRISSRDLEWSDGHYTLLGYSVGELAPAYEAFRRRVHPEDRERQERTLQQSIEHRKEYACEFRVVWPDGSVHWIEARGRCVYDGRGAAARMYGVLVDIDQKRRTEAELRALNETLEQRVADRTAEAEQRAEQLRSLASELAEAEQRERRRLAQLLHDGLQQLLVATKMKIAWLRRDPNPRIAQAADRANELLDESINQSRSLTAELSPPVLYDAGLAGGLKWLARHMHDKHFLSVDVRIGDGAEPADEGTKVFLFQTARELLFNVVKHAETPSARVELTRRGKDRLQLAVSDSGQGFDPAAANVRATSGGFGLFSIRERLELIEGSFRVASSPGGGTRVVIEVPHDPKPPAVLPAAAATENAQRARAGARTRRKSYRKIRVVLADDHAIVRQGLAGLLREHPQIDVVGEASDGRAAVDVARQTQPDVVLMDVNMPGMNGIEATRQIRKSLPGVQVIGLSMHEEAELARAMQAAGAVRYLCKDTACDDLITTILSQHAVAARPRGC